MFSNKKSTKRNVVVLVVEENRGNLVVVVEGKFQIHSYACLARQESVNLA